MKLIKEKREGRMETFARLSRSEVEKSGHEV